MHIDTFLQLLKDNRACVSGTQYVKRWRDQHRNGTASEFWLFMVEDLGKFGRDCRRDFWYGQRHGGLLRVGSKTMAARTTAVNIIWAWQNLLAWTDDPYAQRLTCGRIFGILDISRVPLRDILKCFAVSFEED